MVELNGAHAAALRIGETDYRVRHALEMGVRIEERFGPLRILTQRVENLHLTIREFLDLYRIAFFEQPNPPSEEVLRAHLNRVGIQGAVADLHPILARLFMGEERYVALIARKDAAENPPSAPV